MIRSIKIFLFIMAFAAICSSVRAEERTVTFGRFGKVFLYQQSSTPESVVLFISGDGGWNQGVVDMARELARHNAVVVGVDIVRYIHQAYAGSEKCFYPAADFEALSQFVQKSLRFPQYISPLLVGYSSGATLAYATLVEAPPNTFAGGISLGFCPDLRLFKPLCRGNGLQWNQGRTNSQYWFLPSENLTAPWFALQGTVDQVCHAPQTEAYVQKVNHGKIILLPKVGHGFSVPRNWMPQFLTAFHQILNSEKRAESNQAIVQSENATRDQIRDLPLVELPSKADTSNTLAVIISGDGGWASLDRQIGERLSSEGVSIIGLNSLKYFWNARTPELASRDLERILTYYTNVWNKQKVILIGYSFGADVLPFMASRLPENLQKKITLIALLGPSPAASFEFHVADWFDAHSDQQNFSTMNEMKKLGWTQVLCVYGNQERDSICGELNSNRVEKLNLKGGHHFGGDYIKIAEAIRTRAGLSSAVAKG